MRDNETAVKRGTDDVIIVSTNGIISAWQLITKARIFWTSKLSPLEIVFTTHSNTRTHRTHHQLHHRGLLELGADGFPRATYCPPSEPDGVDLRQNGDFDLEEGAGSSKRAAAAHHQSSVEVPSEFAPPT